MRTAGARTLSSLVLLLLVAVGSCKTAGDLRGSLPAADTQGYLYSRVDNGRQSAESLTNPAVVNLTPQPKGTTSVVVGYKRVHDRTENTTRTYKTEVRRSGNDLSLVVTDIATNEMVVNTPFPAAQDDHGGGTTTPRGTFDSVQACINDFLCKNGSALQCEANGTCRDQFWGLICCLKDSPFCVSVHGVVRPNTLRCQIIGPITDFEAVVFSQ
ncbi:MAG: hypothetical protein AABO58_02470 [Acidobacteriota bacterium]